MYLHVNHVHVINAMLGLHTEHAGLDPFNTWTIYLSPTVTMECINVTENDDYLSTFLVTVSSPTSRVLVIPDRYIGENTGMLAFNTF